MTRSKRAQASIRNALKSVEARKLRRQNTAAQVVHSFDVPFNTQPVFSTTLSAVINHPHLNFDSNFKFEPKMPLKKRGARNSARNVLKAQQAQQATRLKRLQNTTAQVTHSFDAPFNTQPALNTTLSTVANHPHSNFDSTLSSNGSHKRKQTLSVRNELPSGSQQCSSSLFCLFCSKQTTVKLNNFSNYKDVGAADFVPMFVLKKMLNVPSENLVQFLSAFGDPRDWFCVCQTCTPLVTEAFDVQKKICELEWKLKACQKEMKESIAKTYLENQFKEQTIDSPSTTWLGLQKSAVVTKSTRQYVASGVRVTGKPTIYLNVNTAPSPAVQAHCHDDSVPIPEEDAKPYYDEPDDNTHSDGGGNDEMIEEGDPICSEPDNSAANKIPVESERGKSKTTIANLRRKFAKNGASVFSQSEPHYSCALCPNLKPMQLHSFVKHLVFHYDRPYKCRECNAYSSGSDIELAKQSASRQDGDHACSKDTLVKLDLKTEKIWECGYCPSTFLLEDQRKSHEKGLHQNGKRIPLPYKCSTCSNKYRDYHEWRLHRVLEHKDIEKFACFYCDETFKLETKEGVDVEDFRGRFNHIRKVHGNGFYYRHRLDCRICGINFTSANELKDHMDKEHGVQNEIMQCPICFKAIKQRDHLRTHINFVHQERNSGEEEKFMCELCPYVIKNKNTLREHKLLQHGIEPTDGRQIYRCSKDQCTFKAIIKSTMDVHMMKAHGAERKHKCTVCGKGFLNSSHLGDHLLIHKNSKVKPFQCEICGNSFAVKNYLYIHMRLSHQNRPFASTHRKKPSRKRKPRCSEHAVRNLSEAPPTASLPSTSVTQIGISNASSSNPSQAHY